MNKLNLQPLKGFRDFLPPEARKRQYVINILKKVFESYGFEPLETPTLEYEEILSGKYGDEGEKLMYRFEDNGGRRVALRYDQTVPLSRIVAKYQNELPVPFKRYQIQPVWRADNTQKGRYREFLQCDADIIGIKSPYADADTIATIDKSLRVLGFKKYKILLSSRNVLFDKIRAAGIEENLSVPVIRIIDKIKKIGWQQFDKELLALGISDDKTSSLKSGLFTTQPQEDAYLNQVWDACSKLGVSSVTWYPYLARGMDYYTGLIFEVVISEYGEDKSVCGGGRYDNLIGMFAGKKIPAVGFAFGFDRIIEAMELLNLFPSNISSSTTKVLVTVFNKELFDTSLSLSTTLRNNNIATELFPDSNTKLDKQLKYADKKNVPYVILLGPDEIKSDSVTIKNLITKKQTTVTKTDLLNNPAEYLA